MKTAAQRKPYLTLLLVIMLMSCLNGHLLAGFHIYDNKPIGTIRLIDGSLLHAPAELFSTRSSEGDRIDPDNFNMRQLEELILKRIGQVRDSLRLSQMRPEATLHEAAGNHAAYLARKGSLTHTQNKRKYRTPMDRVRRAGGNFRSVAENVAFISTGITYQQGRQRRIEFYTYEEVAQQLVDGWVRSAPHFKNISRAEYDKTAVAVHLDKKKQLIYAVQVFAN